CTLDVVRVLCLASLLAILLVHSGRATLTSKISDEEAGQVLSEACSSQLKSVEKLSHLQTFLEAYSLWLVRGFTLAGLTQLDSATRLKCLHKEMNALTSLSEIVNREHDVCAGSSVELLINYERTFVTRKPQSAMYRACTTLGASNADKEQRSQWPSWATKSKLVGPFFRGYVHAAHAVCRNNMLAHLQQVHQQQLVSEQHFHNIEQLAEQAYAHAHGSPLKLMSSFNVPSCVDDIVWPATVAHISVSRKSGKRVSVDKINRSIEKLISAAVNNNNRNNTNYYEHDNDNDNTKPRENSVSNKQRATVSKHSKKELKSDRVLRKLVRYIQSIDCLALANLKKACEQTFAPYYDNAIISVVRLAQLDARINNNNNKPSSKAHDDNESQQLIGKCLRVAQFCSAISVMCSSTSSSSSSQAARVNEHVFLDNIIDPDLIHKHQLIQRQGSIDSAVENSPQVKVESGAEAEAGALAEKRTDSPWPWNPAASIHHGLLAIHNHSDSNSSGSGSTNESNSGIADDHRQPHSQQEQQQHQQRQQQQQRITTTIERFKNRPQQQISANSSNSIYSNASASEQVQVHEWLRSIGMSCYIDAFERHAWASSLTLLVRQLTLADLTAMGIANSTHQKRIMQALATLRSTTSIGSLEQVDHHLTMIRFNLMVEQNEDTVIDKQMYKSMHGQIVLRNMSYFRGARKLIVGAGVASFAGCAGLAMHMLIGPDTNRVAQASVVKNHLFDAITRTANETSSSNVSPGQQWDFDWDKRDPSSLVKPLQHPFPSEEELKKQSDKLEQVRSHATRHLILVRHGQYNLKGASDEERKLTILGKEQAEFTGVRLKELALPYTRIIQSSMTRARETASIISKHLPDLPVQSCDFLREGAPIQPVPESPNWKPEKKFFEDGARIEAAFRRYFHRAEPDQKEDSYEILACHANVIRYFICRALQFPPEAWLRFSLHNCSITWIAIRPSGRVVVYSVGDIGHMPPTKLTTT
ncbi:Serine/threonine-protein phosphatase PGAM5, mitochondrial, partial [Fragariocoptes setiger]